MNEITMPQDYSSSPEEVRRLLNSGRQQGWRKFKDRFAAATISIGGFGVLFAILLIFFYLLYEIVPLFRSATVESTATYPISKFSDNAAQPLYLTLEEQNEIGMRVDRSGEIVFFKVASGEPLQTLTPPLPAGAALTTFALDSEQNHIVGYGLSDGGVLLLRHDYQSSYTGDARSIEPHLSYPFGETPLPLAPGTPLQALAVHDTESGLVIAGVADNRLVARRWDKREDMLSGEKVIEEGTLPALSADIVPTRLLISPDQRWLYAFAEDSSYRVIDLAKGQVVDSGRLFPDAQISDARFLLGGVSIMVASDKGKVGQWFLVRRADGTPQLTFIRDFPIHKENVGGSRVNLLAAEQRRKGFAAIDGEQRLHLMYSTSERTLLKQSLGEHRVTYFAFSPRANAALYETDNGEMHVLAIDNHHPEVSWSALWNKVWYEHYGEPD